MCFYAPLFLKTNNEFIFIKNILLSFLLLLSSFVPAQARSLGKKQPSFVIAAGICRATCDERVANHRHRWGASPAGWEGEIIVYRYQTSRFRESAKRRGGGLPLLPQGVPLTEPAGTRPLSVERQRAATPDRELKIEN